MVCEVGLATVIIFIMNSIYLNIEQFIFSVEPGTSSMKIYVKGFRASNFVSVIYKCCMLCSGIKSLPN